MQLVQYMDEYLNTSSFDCCPLTLVLKRGLNNLIGKYNEILLDRNRILKSSSTDNPLIVNLDDQLNQFTASIKKSVANFKNAIKIQLAELNRKDLELPANRFYTD